MSRDGDRRTSPATSADVAREAGVSRAAVSVALSGREDSTTRLSPQTRRRILEVAEQLNYTPHPTAVALRKQRSMTMVFVSRPARAEAHEQAIPYLLSTTASRVLDEHGFATLVVQPEPAGSNPKDLVGLILRNRAEGVLWDSPVSAEHVSSLMGAGVPCVMLMRPLEVEGAAGVVIDPRPGIGEAIMHLRQLGHSRVAFIGQQGPHPVDVARIEAFRVAAGEASLEGASTHLVADYSVEAGFGATARALSAGATAVLTSSDGLTLGVLRYLYHQRLRVPDDVSVISFDDAAAADLYPPVTSVRQPFEAIAETAVATLLEAVEAGDLTVSRRALPTTLVVRQSTGPLPGTRRE